MIIDLVAITRKVSVLLHYVPPHAYIHMIWNTDKSFKEVFKRFAELETEEIRCC